MTDLYLSIVAGKRAYEFDVALHDDETEPGKCRMVVSLNSTSKLQALLHEKKESGLEGKLVERTTGQEVPIERHPALRIVEASRITGLLDASVVGGGEVVAEILG